MFRQPVRSRSVVTSKKRSTGRVAIRRRRIRFTSSADHFRLFLRNMPDSPINFPDCWVGGVEAMNDKVVCIA